MKILVVFGTRPEAIKMCPLIKILNKSKGIVCKVCITGQHREMLHQVLNVFEITVDYDLNIMKENQTLFDITYEVMEGIRRVNKIEKPDMVLVHGDTSTTFSTALACFYERIPIGHVEAGLRTYNRYSPYPEEFNRQAVDSIATLYFAPTKYAEDNLIREGKNKESIYVTGNTAIDALKTTVTEEYKNEILDWCGESRLILLTAHRRENWKESLENIFCAVKDIVEKYEDVKVVYPMHKNPIIREKAYKILGNNSRVKLTEPLSVIDFHNIMNKAYLVLTDSGGIQEEAPSLGKPVLVLRDTTERPEGVKAGTLKLAGVKHHAICMKIEELLNDINEYKKMSKASNPYGDGHASERIAKFIIEWGIKNGVY